VLRALPATTLFGFSSRRAADGRPSSGVTRFLRDVFYSRLKDEAYALERALHAIDAARGDRQVFACLSDFTLLVAGSVRDARGLSRGFSELFTLPARAPWDATFRALAGKPSLVRNKLTLAGSRVVVDRFRYRFVPAARPGVPPAPPIVLDALLLVEAEEFALAVGPRAEAGLLAFLSARARGEQLGALSDAARALAVAKAGADWALFANLAPFGARQYAPLAASGRSNGSEVEVDVGLADRAVESLVSFGLTP
jgi:hypothetical protein